MELVNCKSDQGSDSPKITDIPNQQPTPPSLESLSVNPRYKGVSGWLLLLCIVLTVSSPSATIGLFAILVSREDFTISLVIPYIHFPLTFVFMAFSVYAGIKLWRIQPGAVRVAMRYLLCLLGYRVFVAMHILLIQGSIPLALYVVIGTGGFVYIWYSYLQNSQRVRDTYGVIDPTD